MTNQLHQMNPLERFNNRAEDYAKYRPSYPSEAIDCILEGFKQPDPLTAADIGARTGIASSLLADKEVRVMAIEPSAGMRQAATPHPLIQFEDGNAENTQLEDNSVNLVTCFQAFHWFNPEPTLSEFARILKPGGKLAVVWNNRDRSDKFTKEYGNLMKIAANSKPKLRKDRIKSLHNTSLFSSVRHLVFPYQYALDRDGLVGRAMSASYVPKTGKIYEKLTKKLNKLYERYCDDAGLVYFKYKTNVYLTSVD
ncbi:MAG: class I SAM-dependent methyltransferase [Pleurocapsa sp.]